jgi:hypothetical protein
MDHILSELLSEVPNEIFFNDQGKPNYNAIFVEIARVIYREETNDFSIPAGDFLEGDRLPNLSTFQRNVAHERERREGRRETSVNRDVDTESA